MTTDPRSAIERAEFSLHMSDGAFDPTVRACDLRTLLALAKSALAPQEEEVREVIEEFLKGHSIERARKARDLLARLSTRSLANDEARIIADYLRRRSKQRPSDGLIERQSLTEDHILYGQALLAACADDIERRGITALASQGE
jgi:hypothetical protein